MSIFQSDALDCLIFWVILGVGDKILGQIFLIYL